jgi:hypothetical protein
MSAGFRGLSADAMPIGILMFLATLSAFLLRKLGRRRARQQFPELSRELGLEFTPPRYAGAVGTLTGTYKGRTVRIDPDDQRLIKVRFHAAPRIDLRSYEHSMRAPFDMVTIHSKDRVFDRFFKTRFATEEIAERIAAASEPGRMLAPFMGRFARQVQSLTVTGDGVVCRLDFGSPPYIPAGALHELLPACVSLADLIEPEATAVESTPHRGESVQ